MQLILDVPEYFMVDRTTTELVNQIKLYASLTMYRSGQISAGGACEFAGVDRYDFLAACKKYNVNTVDYDESDLENEFRQIAQG